MITTVEVGDFVTIPAWRTFGQVVSVSPSWIGEADSLDIVVQEHPEQRIADCRLYRLRPGEFEVEA